MNEDSVDLISALLDAEALFMSLDRRRFLGLVSAGSAGLFLPVVGLVELPRKLVIEYSGECSFCGKKVTEVFALAGLRQGGPVRICNECVELCLDIMQEAPLPDRPLVQTSDRELAAGVDPDIQAAERIASVQEEIARQIEEWRSMVSEELRAVFESEAQAYQAQYRSQRQKQGLSCSFCQKTQHEVTKLIAGPSVYICDHCIGDAAGLLAAARAR